MLPHPLADQVGTDFGRQHGTPLYIVQAHDVAVRAENEKKLTDAVRADLLRYVNPEDTKGLPSFLPIYRGMRLLLNSKDCVRLGIMKGCPVVVRDIVFADDEALPYDHVPGRAHMLRYMPVSLILQAEEVRCAEPDGRTVASTPLCGAGG